MEVQQMGSPLLLEQQLAGKDQLFVPPGMGLVSFPNKRKFHACAGLGKILACKSWLACPLKLLEIRSGSGQFWLTYGSLWNQLRGRTIHHLPRLEGGFLVDRRPKHKLWKESMVLQVGNLHMRIRGSFPNPCFSAHLEVTLCQCEDGDFAQDMAIWLEVFICGGNYSKLLFDSATEDAASLLLISNYSYAKLSLYHILALEILNLWFWPLNFAAQGFKCQNWNNVHSVILWRQANIIVNNLNHQFCSHTRNEIYGQQRFWKYLYACKTINKGNVILVQNSSFMSSKGTLFCLPDDHLVEDAILLPFGLCHQRWTTTPLLLILRFNGGDPLRLSSVMVPRNLQLNPPQPQVHTPDRPSGEPPVGHQLVWSTMEALEDCRCSNIESVLSTDERSLFGFIGNLRYQLHVFRSSFYHTVCLSTFDGHLTLCRPDMLYYEL